MDKIKWNDTVFVTCDGCQKTFQRTKGEIHRHNAKGKKRAFCGAACYIASQNKPVVSPCLQCGASVKKIASEAKRTPNFFCNKSCSAIYRNSHKSHGTRRSKLEAWLEEQLSAVYPSLEFHFNRKDAINSELDIYIPSLKLAFELNGVFHYEPIFGVEKLARIQNNDERKYQACIEHGIELCLIDASSFKYFKPSGAVKYLNVVRSLIDKKVGPPRIELGTKKL